MQKGEGDPVEAIRQIQHVLRAVQLTLHRVKRKRGAAFRLQLEAVVKGNATIALARIIDRACGGEPIEEALLSQLEPDERKHRDILRAALTGYIYATGNVPVSEARSLAASAEGHISPDAIAKSIAAVRRGGPKITYSARLRMFRISLVDLLIAELPAKAGRPRFPYS